MFSLFISAFVLGIVSSLHCIGMCGPIALAIPLNRNSKTEAFIGVIEYNFGRILTYTTLGLIVGYIGLGIQLIGFLQGLSIIAGIFIILYAWRKKISLLNKISLLSKLRVFVLFKLHQIINSSLNCNNIILRI